MCRGLYDELCFACIVGGDVVSSVSWVGCVVCLYIVILSCCVDRIVVGYVFFGLGNSDS